MFSGACLVFWGFTTEPNFTYVFGGINEAPRNSWKMNHSQYQLWSEAKTTSKKDSDHSISRSIYIYIQYIPYIQYIQYIQYIYIQYIQYILCIMYIYYVYPKNTHWFPMFPADSEVWPLLVLGALHGARAGAKRSMKSAQSLATWIAWIHRLSHLSPIGIYMDIIYIYIYIYVYIHIYIYMFI